MILSKEFLDSIVKQNPQPDSYLGNLARDQKHFHLHIAQINRMWDQLPENGKKSRELISRIQSINTSAFKGALAEIITNWVLKKFVIATGYSLNISGKTPDFFAVTDTHQFFVEVFCTGKDQTDRDYDRVIELLAEEIKGVESKIRISIDGLPKPNQQGNFGGIKEVLQSYLSSSRDFANPLETHTISYEGAVVSFVAIPFREKGEVFTGYVAPTKVGDNQVPILKSRLESKIGKYVFPFVASCVADSLLDADLFTLSETMVGPETFAAGGKQVGFTEDGFWGRKNPLLLRNLRLQAVIYIRKYTLEDTRIQLHVHMVENPFIRIGFREVFEKIPDIWKTKFDGDPMKMPALLLTP